VEKPSDSVLGCPLRVRNMDASAAKSEVPVGTPSMYIIDRLNAHDPARFQYKGLLGPRLTVWGPWTSDNHRHIGRCVESCGDHVR
jgi:hypothetical protein